MLQLTPKIQEMLEEDYRLMAHHCDLKIVDTRANITVGDQIRFMDGKLFEAGEDSTSICTYMKLEVETLEVVSNDNKHWAIENPKLKNYPMEYDTLFKNYELNHGPDDFGMRWQEMVHEMSAPRNRRYAACTFGENFPGPLELFFTYRMRGMIYNYCTRHGGEAFTFPECWGKIPDTSETIIIKLLWMYKEERAKKNNKQ